jgi:hypothetical protein
VVLTLGVAAEKVTKSLGFVAMRLRMGLLIMMILLLIRRLLILLSIL